MAELSIIREDSINLSIGESIFDFGGGMYIGKLGDGSAHEIGIYVMVKRDSRQLHWMRQMGFGRTIDVKITEHKVSSRLWTWIPSGKSHWLRYPRYNTGGKYIQEHFQKSVGLNGVGTYKPVNGSFRSDFFKKVQAYREGETKSGGIWKGDF